MKINLEIEFILSENVKISKKHIALLKQIKIDKSISKAAKSLKISYKNAWDSLDEINKASKQAIFLQTSRKAGTKLSEFGEEILAKYDEFCEFRQKLNDDFRLKTSAQNAIKATVKEIKQVKNYIKLSCESAGIQVNTHISLNALKELNLKLFDEIYLIFKINFIELECEGENSFLAKITKISPADEFIYLGLELNSQPLRALARSEKLSKKYQIGSYIRIRIPPEKIIISL